MHKVDIEQWLGQHNDYLVDAGHGHFLHPEVLTDFTAMQNAALHDGIDLQLVSSYRDFSRQMAIFNRKWRGDATLLNAEGQVLNFSALTQEEKLHAILTWSALPGGSRHHWGTDIDVYDKQAVAQSQQPFNLICAEYEKNGPCYSLACWLESNMATFGFYRPFDEYKGGVAREPWHLSHKSTATYFEKARNLDDLAHAISQSDIDGKAYILSQLPLLYTRYVLNNGRD
ncbi:peptidase M15 [Alteromonas sp. KUL42]|uniref:M15 family metallopeptidase n=1 Tax=Alteromonas sp. KUL42 TaxID=2480797 RepID=UPI00103552D0|nr:M15 family metallopeptidase [Alteromonas sp. KUL42]TAP34336.1 D-alanyl-D-alanine carboxypeptidase family protein [Alteromonas sp. KUL42]GEA07728.1 peptidase M15 [Alteromonas sp. KUL42]